ncbi:hypothetical protein ACKKBG_A31170 [Auxenochlorella protothecoides x Auxenochlorella symbiontica]
MADSDVDEYQKRWEASWNAGLKPGERFDACQSSPALLDLLKRGTVAVEGKRVFVPGCGRGYDPVTFIKAGAKEAIGLELAPSATPAANEYIAAQSVDTSQCYVETGDFFKWKDPAGFDVGYDYTFLCAMHPTMREDWAKAWHGHLSPGGKLITLIFPINPAADPGPPWYIHADMCKELLIPAGFELETLEKVPDELSLKGREGMEMTAVWRRI